MSNNFPPVSSGFKIGAVLGIIIGAAAGFLTDRFNVFMPLGICVGLCLGIVFDEIKNRKENNDEE